MPRLAPVQRRDGKPKHNVVHRGQQGLHLKGVVNRSSHLGYDCYRSGPMNGDGGRIRITLRPTRIPPHVRLDVRALLPVEMWWPQPDHPAAHGCIDAVMTLDSKSMRAWKDAWPDHNFGFEDFMVWCDRKLEARAIREPDVKPAVAVEMGRVIVRSQRFPTDVHKVVQMQSLPYERYLVRLALTTFTDKSTALRVTVVGRIPGGTTTRLSRAYVDPVDHRYEVIEHHPGRYQALELPEDLIYSVLKVRRGKPLGKIMPEDLRAHDPRPEPHIGAPHPVEYDKSDLKERRVEGRRTSRVSAAIHEDVFDAFPAAPGG